MPERACFHRRHGDASGPLKGRGLRLLAFLDRFHNLPSLIEVWFCWLFSPKPFVEGYLVGDPPVPPVRRAHTRPVPLTDQSDATSVFETWCSAPESSKENFWYSFLHGTPSVTYIVRAFKEIRMELRVSSWMFSGSL